MDAHDVSTNQSFETEAHSKKGALEDKVSGANVKNLKYFPYLVAGEKLSPEKRCEVETGTKCGEYFGG